MNIQDLEHGKSYYFNGIRVLAGRVGLGPWIIHPINGSHDLGRGAGISLIATDDIAESLSQYSNTNGGEA